VDEEIQELLLSLYDDGLLALPPETAPKSSRRIWKCIGGAALFSIAVFFLFFIPETLDSIKKNPEPISSPTYIYERDFWSSNTLSPKEPVTKELLFHLDVIQNEQARRETFSAIQKEIATLLESPLPIEYARLQTLIGRIYQADIDYTESLPQGELPFCALTERKDHYEALKQELIEKRETLNSALKRAQRASSLQELNETVRHTVDLLEQWQSSIDPGEYTQKLCDLSLESLERIAATYTYTSKERADKEREALWHIRSLLPHSHIFITLEHTLSSHSECLFIEKIELPQNDNPLASIRRQIESTLFPTNLLLSKGKIGGNPG